MKYKNNFKLGWDKLIHEGYFIALGDISAICAFVLILDIKITWDFLLVVFLIIFSLCSFNYYRDIEHDALTNSKRAEMTRRRMRFLPFGIVSTLIVALGLTYYYSSLKTIIFLIFLLFAGLLYTTTLKGLTSKIVGFKSFYVAFFYSLLLVLLMIYYALPLSMAFLLVFTFYFSRIFINTFFCDIRDIESDKKNGLKTFAVVFGEDRAILILGLLNILTILPLFLGVYWGVLPLFSLAILMTVPYVFFNLVVYKKGIIHHLSLFNILVEGEFLFWLPLVLAGKYIVVK